MHVVVGECLLMMQSATRLASRRLSLALQQDMTVRQLHVLCTFLVIEHVHTYTLSLHMLALVLVVLGEVR